MEPLLAADTLQLKQTQDMLLLIRQLTADKRKHTLDRIKYRQDLLELIKQCRTVAEQRLSEMLSAGGEGRAQ